MGGKSTDIVLQGDDNEKASIFTGEEELFAFQRVVSRLIEMQTEDYWQERDIIIEKRKAHELKKQKLKESAQAEAGTKKKKKKHKHA